MKVDTPKGVRQLSFEESYTLDTIQKIIEDNFKLWGYDKLYLPLIEYYHTHSKTLDKNLLKNSFRIVDRYEGETLILRPDFTTQIARFVASLKDKTFPLRVYYCGDIFRYTVPKADNIYQRRQVGVELIGVPQIEADAEVIAVAVTSLKSLGISDFQIDINNVKIHYGIKEILNLDDGTFAEFMGFIKNREIYNLKKFVSKFILPEDLKEFIVSLPKLKGGIEIISNLKDKLPTGLKEPIDELVKIYSILKEYGLSDYLVFDLGEPKEFEYYTGIVFEVFSVKNKKVIGTGGRYDNLISKYNGDYPATGFAFDLYYLMDILIGKFHNKKDYYIIDTTDDKLTAYRIASNLRSKGFSVARDIVKRDVEKSMDIAFKKGFENVIIITVENNKKRVYIFSKNGEKKVLEIKDILG
ncbi:MAG: ATP phosphoribosyltransferase regulatory subunit [Hydrogenothermaceae bacterium]|nr:ATP phosphoribosyltransferase regulatory subunit [Hydrogenothermaceae bacterium]